MGKRAKIEGFVVFDIENYENPHPKEGQMISGDLCWRDKGEIKHFAVGNWREFWDFVYHRARFDGRFRRIWAHNGLGWDWKGFLEWYRDCGETHQLTELPANGIKIELGDEIEGEFKSAKRLSIQLVDSIKVLKGSLESLSQKFLGRGKVDTGKVRPYELWENDRETYWKYLRGDTENLLEILESALRIVNDRICSLPTFKATLASTALAIFTKGFNSIKIHGPHHDPFLESFMRKGYRGGRVEAFQPGIHRRIYVYDINSLYPSVMRTTNVPINTAGRWTSIFEPGKHGVYNVRFRQSRRDILPVLMVGGDGSYCGEGTYFSPELNLLKEMDPDAIIHVTRGRIFYDCQPVFREFVDKMYALRQTDLTGPLGEICKLCMNSLYGKFAEKGFGVSIRCVRTKLDFLHLFQYRIRNADGEWEWTDDDDVKYFQHGKPKPEFEPNRPKKMVEDLDPELGFYKVSAPRVVRHGHVGIAGMITSQSRVQLYRGFNAVGHENVAYCDTDSVHSLVEMPGEMISSSELGQFKLESIGEGAYCGKKTYSILTLDNIEKIKAKGIRVFDQYQRKNGKICLDESGQPIKREFNQEKELGDLLCHEEMKKVARGKVHEAHYKSTATNYEILLPRKQRKQANRFYQRHRRIRKNAMGIRLEPRR